MMMDVAKAHRDVWRSMRVAAALLALVALFVITSQPTCAMQPATGAADNAAQMDPHTTVESVEPMPEESGLQFALTMLTVLAAPVSLGLLYWRRWYKLDGKKLRARLFEPVVGLGLLLILFAASALGGMAALRFILGVKGELSALPLDVQLKATVVGLLGTFTAQALVLFAAWFMLMPHTKSRLPRLHRPSVSAAGAFVIGVGALVLFWPIVVTAGLAASELWHWLFDKPTERIAHDTLAMLVESPADGWRLALIVLVIIGPAVFEEIFYRGILHRMLRGLMFKPWHAIIITSAIFTLMHGNVAAPHALVALFVLSLGLGWVYERTGRLAAPIAMHMAFNAANAALALMVT